jgi:hypothetical protein
MANEDEDDITDDDIDAVLGVAKQAPLDYKVYHYEHHSPAAISQWHAARAAGRAPKELGTDHVASLIVDIVGRAMIVDYYSYGSTSTNLLSDRLNDNDMKFIANPSLQALLNKRNIKVNNWWSGQGGPGESVNKQAFIKLLTTCNFKQEDIDRVAR